MKFQSLIYLAAFQMAFMYSITMAQDSNANDKYFFATTNVKLSDLTDLTTATYDLSDPLKNYLVKDEEGGKWLQGIQGIVFTPVEWSHETTFYMPSSVEQDTSITSGKFVEYTGSQKWRWFIKEAKKTESGKGGLKHSEIESSFVVEIDFEPYRPEPPSIITSRNNANLGSKDCWWFPPLYLNPKSLKMVSDNEKEKVICPLGSIECYKLRFKNGKLSQGSLENFILLSNKVEAILWYDVIRGILVKEELKTDKEEEFIFTINKTNIQLIGKEQ